MVEHVLSNRRGDWRVLIVGSQESDRWVMNIFGPNSFERSYTLEGSAGEHDPRVVGSVIAKIVPATEWAQKESFRAEPMSNHALGSFLSLFFCRTYGKDCKNCTFCKDSHFWHAGFIANRSK
jgi:hypothetical protein